MRIDTISLTNFKNFKKLENLKFTAGVNLFVGINGSGKTSLLEAITIGMGSFFGSQPKLLQRHPEASELRIENEQRAEKLKVACSTDFEEIGGWSRSFTRNTNTPDSGDLKKAKDYGEKIFAAFEDIEDKTLAPLLSYYSTQRLHSDGRESKKQQYDPYLKRRNGYLLWQDERAIKRTLTSWLSTEAYNEYSKAKADVEEINMAFNNVMEAIKETIYEFVDGATHENKVRIFDRVLREVITSKETTEREVKVFLEIEGKTSLPLDYYSDGFRNLLYLIVDLVWRASQLNPWLTYEELKERSFGIVAIDEVDLHLHPTWQAKAIPFLQSLFPGVQYFISTHSPTVVANFEHGNLYIIDGQKVELYEYKYFGKEINSVLIKILGANDRNYLVQLEIDRLFKAIELEESEEAIKAKLNALKDKLGENDFEIQKAIALIEWNKIKTKNGIH